jgi:hypothetical protein
MNECVRGRAPPRFAGPGVLNVDRVMALLALCRASDTIESPVHSTRKKGFDGPEFTRPRP